MGRGSKKKLKIDPYPHTPSQRFFCKYLSPLKSKTMAPNPFTEINDRLDVLTQMVAELMKKPSSNGSPVADTPLSAAQAAKYVDMAVNTIYILTSKRQIPHFKRGKRVYFYKDELDNWLKANRRKTIEEIESEA